MLPNIMMNFPSDADLTIKLRTCSGCTVGEDGCKLTGCRDTQQHMLYALDMLILGRRRTLMKTGYLSTTSPK